MNILNKIDVMLEDINEGKLDVDLRNSLLKLLNIVDKKTTFLFGRLNDISDISNNEEILKEAKKQFKLFKNNIERILK